MPTYNEIVSPVAEFFGYTPEAALSGRSGPRKTEATWQDRVLGISSSELKEEDKLQEQYDLKERLGGDYEEVTGKKWNPNLSEGQVRRSISDARKETAGDDAVETHTRLYNLPGGGADQARIASERYSDQMQLTRAQMAKGDKRYMLEMADRKDERAMDREERRSRERKEDLRYNENIERMDRKDRRASIQTLVAGLANLGAAFAV